MNIVDKHRELVMCFDTAQFLPNDPEKFIRYQTENPDLSPMEVARHFQSDGQFISHISHQGSGSAYEKQLVQPDPVTL